MANEKTPNYHWDIPNPYGLQIVEMMKVASTFGAIDSRFKAFEDAYLSHKHSFADITDRPTTLNGYGITDAVTTDEVKSEIEASQAAQQSVIDQSIQSLANSTADAIALRVRADAAQAFTLAQKSRARQNIDALGTIDRGVPNGVATLDAGGKIPSSQLPPVAISETFVVNSQASMLALVAERGDIAVRPDLNKTFILRLEPATVLANWQEILTPADGVLSVNGLTGPVINLEPAHLNLGNVANKSEAQMVSSGEIADALGGKVSKSGGTMTGALIAPGIDTTNGSLTIKNDGYSHLWFRNAAGTEKAVIFCNNAGENATFRVNGTQHFNFQANGSFVAPQNLAAYSDARLKSEVETICDALAIIKNLRGARYIKGGVKQIGLIAQEVRVVVPEAVFENTDEDDPFLKAGHKTGTLSVAADNTLLAVVIEAVKELAAEVKVLKERLK